MWRGKGRPRPRGEDREGGLMWSGGGWLSLDYRVALGALLADELDYIVLSRLWREEICVSLQKRIRYNSKRPLIPSLRIWNRRKRCESHLEITVYSC
jgi:hypothetical protein